MNYIDEVPNTISEKLCQQLIDYRNDCLFEQFQDFNFWRGQDFDIECDLLMDQLAISLEVPLKCYLESFGGLLSLDKIELKSISLINQPPGAHDELHFDTCLVEYKKRKLFRPFVCLVYLNDEEFEGGQLVFPIQKKVIEASARKMVIFPASHFFPHQVLPLSGGCRKFVRLNYFCDESYFDTYLESWNIEKNGAQKFV